MSAIAFFCIASLLFLMAVFLSGYIRLYLMANMKVRNVIIVSIITFLVGEIILLIYIINNGLTPKFGQNLN